MVLVRPATRLPILEESPAEHPGFLVHAAMLPSCLSLTPPTRTSNSSSLVAFLSPPAVPTHPACSVNGASALLLTLKEQQGVFYLSSFLCVAGSGRLLPKRPVLDEAGQLGLPWLVNRTEYQLI